jgi:hypothetical protein
MTCRAAVLLILVVKVLSSCSRPENSIVAENCRPGNPSTEWDVNGAGDPTIQGYSTDISYNVGETAFFKISTPSSDYRVDIYRLGYYGGLGARLITSVRPGVPLPQKQPDCFVDNETWLYDCKEWDVSAEWLIPQDTTSGVFIARLVRMDGVAPTWRADNSPAGGDPRFAMPGEDAMKKPTPQPHAYGALGYGKLRNRLKEPRASLIYFVVRNDESVSDIVVQTSDTVWQAYNNEGGTSTYGSIDPANPRPRCFKASLNRPLKTRAQRPVNAYLGSEYPINRFLEANGYDVTYIAGVDTDRHGATLLHRHKVFFSNGHDEYWSGQQRHNVEEARNRGMHLVFLSGNEMYWRVRWEDNYRTMVVYKESQSPTKIDPVANEWTGTFRDSRPINPLGAQPENAVTGQIFTINAWRNDPLVVPGRFSRHRQWRDTEVALLRHDQRSIFLRGILGHEMDEDVDNGFRPAGLIHLSETQVDNCMYIMDFGSTYDSGSAVHHLTMYKHASGAIVFGAGTVQWGWALDAFHDSESGIPANLVNHLNTRVGTDILAPVVAVQQFTVNFLADMGAQPATLAPTLTRATESTDSGKPYCMVDSVHALEENTFAVHIIAGDDVGVVAAVEVRAGAADRWHPATPASADGSSWSYTFSSLSAPMDVRCRATDDSLNLGAESGAAHHNNPHEESLAPEGLPSNFLASEEVEL